MNTQQIIIISLLLIAIIAINHLRITLSRKLNSITQKQKKMDDKTTQALADLEGIKTQLQKIGTESATSLAKIIELENAANADPATPQSVLDKIAEVKAQVQIVDDLVPDAPAGDGTEG